MTFLLLDCATGSMLLLSVWHTHMPAVAVLARNIWLGHGSMASAVARAYNGGLGRSPQWDLEADPLVFGHSMEAANLLTFPKFGNTKK